MAQQLIDRLLTSKAVVFLTGPTASGKTDLAVALHVDFPVRIISVDSALIYRGMDIGTAKPDHETLLLAPHHLIDICDPRESYSVARFRQDALNEIEMAHESGQVPLLTGGTMMYFNALEKGISSLPSSDPEVRAALVAEQERHGLEYLHQQLANVDPEAAARIHKNDPQRIIRALGVYQQTGKSMSHLQAEARSTALHYPVIKIARSPEERSVLHERIAKRFEQMLKQGFEKEVRGLIEQEGMHADLPSMRAVGYRQMLEYIQGKLTYQQMQERGVIATRQLAKRQYTWLRSMSDVNWLYDRETDLLGSPLALLRFLVDRLRHISII